MAKRKRTIPSKEKTKTNVHAFITCIRTKSLPFKLFRALYTTVDDCCYILREDTKVD